MRGRARAREREREREKRVHGVAHRVHGVPRVAAGLESLGCTTP
jgi:hypothetical protein